MGKVDLYFVHCFDLVVGYILNYLSVSVMPSKTKFNVDNVRVCKILGAGLLQSDVIQGMVFKRQIEGDITRVENAKVVVFTSPLDSLQTETKVSG